MSEVPLWCETVNLWQLAQSEAAVLMPRRQKFYAGMRWDVENLNTPKRRVTGAIYFDFKPSFMPNLAYLPVR